MSLRNGMRKYTQTFLQELKLRQLHNIARLIGVNSTGRKNEVLQRVEHALAPNTLFPVNRPAERILSIDMGIRNLAYSVLDVKRSKEPPKVKYQWWDREAEVMPKVWDEVTLHSWRRLAVSGPTSGLNLEPSSSIKPDTDPSNVETNNAVAMKESFDPSSLARVAINLVQQLLIEHQPTTILIERQRHRSGGASAVLEWTIRVNMLESMLFAILEYERTLFSSKATGIGDRTPFEIHSVNPRQISSFWTASSSSLNTRVSRSSSKLEKEHKIGLVEEWLDVGALRLTQSALQGSTNQTAVAFLAARRKRNTGLKLTSSPTGNAKPLKLTKLDDLADSLVQGITWLQWDVNRRSILAEMEQRALDSPTLPSKDSCIA